MVDRRVHTGRVTRWLLERKVEEIGGPVLEALVEKHVGAKVVSIHSDILTKSEEWLD